MKLSDGLLKCASSTILCLPSMNSAFLFKDKHIILNNTHTHIHNIYVYVHYINVFLFYICVSLMSHFTSVWCLKKVNTLKT